MEAPQGTKGQCFQGAAGTREPQGILPGGGGDVLGRSTAAKDGGTSYQALHRGLHSPHPPTSLLCTPTGGSQQVANEWRTSSRLRKLTRDLNLDISTSSWPARWAVRWNPGPLCLTHSRPRGGKAVGGREGRGRSLPPVFRKALNDVFCNINKHLK